MKLDIRKSKISFAAVIAATVLSAGLQAKADDAGTAGGGGGNSLQGLMIPNYLVKDPYNDSRLPGFSNVVNPFIDYVKARLPLMSDDLRKAVHQQNIYVVPTRIRHLPYWASRLPFWTTQTCIQNGYEIFCDEVSLQRVTSNPQARRMLYFGEVIEATFGGSSDGASEAARLVVDFLDKNPNSTSAELQQEIRRDEGVLYPVASDMIAINKMIKEFDAQLDTLCKSVVADQSYVDTFKEMLRVEYQKNYRQCNAAFGAYPLDALFYGECGYGFNSIILSHTGDTFSSFAAVQYAVVDRHIKPLEEVFRTIGTSMELAGSRSEYLREAMFCNHRQ